MDTPTLYERVGGMPFFDALVGRFYQGVAADPVLRAMYPEDDLGPAEERLRLFLVQYWGGPTTYSDQRGHPRLRMRHAPFPIDAEARDRWLACMGPAIDATVADLPDDPGDPDRRAEVAAALHGYVGMAADAMRNLA